MPRYKIHFADGKTIEKDAPDGTTAKNDAKRERRREADPNTPASDPTLRVDRVEELSTT